LKDQVAIEVRCVSFWVIPGLVFATALSYWFG